MPFKGGWKEPGVGKRARVPFKGGYKEPIWDARILGAPFASALRSADPNQEASTKQPCSSSSR